MRKRVKFEPEVKNFKYGKVTFSSPPKEERLEELRNIIRSANFVILEENDKEWAIGGTEIVIYEDKEGKEWRPLKLCDHEKMIEGLFAFGNIEAVELSYRRKDGLHLNLVIENEEIYRKIKEGTKELMEEKQNFYRS